MYRYVYIYIYTQIRIPNIQYARTAIDDIGVECACAKNICVLTEKYKLDSLSVS